jgi:hypothetical protein
MGVEPASPADGDPAPLVAPVVVVMVIVEGAVVPHPELGGGSAGKPGVADLIGGIDEPERLVAFDLAPEHFDLGRLRAAPGHLGRDSGTAARLHLDLTDQVVDGDVAAEDGVALDLLGMADGGDGKGEDHDGGPGGSVTCDGLHGRLLREGKLGVR